MSKPTGLARDSSLWIEYGPRDCGSCREAQTAEKNIECFGAAYQRPFAKSAGRLETNA